MDHESAINIFFGGGGGGGRRRFITKSANNYKTVHYLQKAETQT